MKFVKMEGCGNDYIYVDGAKEHIVDKPEIVKRLSDRHFGIGGDGVIFINPSKQADFEMEMYNADGSRSEMCGNGIRCVAKYVYDFGLTDKKEITIESAGKIKYLSLTTEEGKVSRVRVDMGEPQLLAKEIPVISAQEKVLDEEIEVDGRIYRMTCVSMGNPHAVVFVDDVENMDLEKIGPKFENHPRFPKRVNTEFVTVLDDHTVRMRVWERGTGETLACGTGSCATAVACLWNQKTGNDITVKLTGGDLQIVVEPDMSRVYMTGPATMVFSGEVDISFLSR
ncbi:MAG: diaminopimelate epimerase [Lachnospiraceae bacterium]